jgi:hypothetical protein
MTDIDDGAYQSVVAAFSGEVVGLEPNSNASRNSNVKPTNQGVKNGGTDKHNTPQPVIDCLDEFWPNGIDLDPCSNDTSLVKARIKFTIADDGLKRYWTANNSYINPPYSENAVWADKFATEWDEARLMEAVVLNKNDSRPKWYATYMERASAVCIVKGGLKFGDSKTIAMFPSILFYFGDRSVQFCKVFRQLGWCFSHAQKYSFLEY